MSLPPLYKYLDVDGAKRTLEGQCFRHAKPSTFNDREDLTVVGMFPGSLEQALADIRANLGGNILANVNRVATCPKRSMREVVTAIQDIFRAKPGAAPLFVRQLQEKPELLKLDVENVEQLATVTISDINEHMQQHRVFCVTTHRDSERMWSGYAEQHKGIALRVEASQTEDSKFDLFRPVSYREKRPTIYRDAVHFLTSNLFDNHEASNLAAMNDIIYTKTLDWQHESEYRLVIALGPGEADWDLLKFHAEEITELYLGLAMDQANKADILEKAKVLNPGISVFQMKRDEGGVLAWDRQA